MGEISKTGAPHTTGTPHESEAQGKTVAKSRLSEFVARGMADMPVYITEARENFTVSLGTDLVLDLEQFDDTVRRFRLRLPTAEAESSSEMDFLRDYLFAETYNILSSLGGARLRVYAWLGNSRLSTLLAGMRDAFGIGAPRNERAGYGRCVNVIERMLDSLGAALPFDITVIDGEPPALKEASPQGDGEPPTLKGASSQEDGEPPAFKEAGSQGDGSNDGRSAECSNRANDGRGAECSNRTNDGRSAECSDRANAGVASERNGAPAEDIAARFAKAFDGIDKRILLGVDIGGTDIKLAASVNGSLLYLKEYDWFPASFTRAAQLIEPVRLLARLLRARVSCDLAHGTRVEPFAAAAEDQKGSASPERAGDAKSAESNAASPDAAATSTGAAAALEPSISLAAAALEPSNSLAAVVEALDRAICEHLTDGEIEAAVVAAEHALGDALQGFDAIGLCFPDVVIRNKIVGGEVFKTRGIRENPDIEYEPEFGKLTGLDSILREFCVPGGAAHIVNDGPMAAFTAAMELVAAGRGAELRDGRFAHTLGTELGSGWIDETGSIPEIPLEVYNAIIDLGSYGARRYHPDDLRSINNFNTGLPGTLQKFMAQNGVFRLAIKASQAGDGELYQSLLKGGYIREDGEESGSGGRSGGVFVALEPKDMRKPLLERLMRLCEEGDPIMRDVFLEVGRSAGITFRETERILSPRTRERVMYGRLVKTPRCFELIKQGAAEIDAGHTLTVADGDSAFSGLMRQLNAHPRFTVAQFAQAVGALYYGNLHA